MMRKICQRILAKMMAFLLKASFHCQGVPFCKEFGTGRGGSISRYYVDLFIKKHAPVVKGRVLDFGNRNYEKCFDKAQIVSYDVFDIVPNTQATLTGDIQNCPEIPDGSFDTIICSQVLEHVFQKEKALRELYRILAPGGLLLLSVPFHGFIHGAPNDYWRYTPSALHEMISSFPFKSVEYERFGNVYVASMYSLGLGMADTNRRILDEKDEHSPLIVACAARKS